MIIISKIRRMALPLRAIKPVPAHTSTGLLNKSVESLPDTFYESLTPSIESA